MIYLGIHNSYQAGAALIIDKNIIGAVSEERFNRVKDYHGFPHLSIDYLLKTANIELKDIDRIVYGMVTSEVPKKEVFEKLLKKVADGISENPLLKNKYIERIISEIEWNQKHLIEINSWGKKNKVNDKISFVDHHHSHAAGAFYSSPFVDALIFTCDGKGNFKTSCVGMGNGKKIILHDFTTTFDSVGYFYGNITKALGFTPERHEGKITGLAAYGNPDNFKWFTNDIMSIKDDMIKMKIGKHYLPWFVDPEELPAFFNQIKKYKPEDVAAAAQYTLENIIIKWVQRSIEKYHSSSKANVCLSGGVFANVKLNQKIREITSVKNVFVQPAMGDMGIPLGSCFAQMQKEKNPFKKFISSMALGPKYSPEFIESHLIDQNYEYKIIEVMEKQFVSLLNQGKVIGFFQGGMEFGPRALCNRSIMYHCRDRSVNDWLNKRLNRTEFMPFAPVTTEDLASSCFLGWKSNDRSSDFMTMTYTVTDRFNKSCPAAVHIDGTARPQIIRKKVNPQMYDIITYFNKTSGDLALINTSFNNHEEPIVCRVEDALESLDRGNVDCIIIDNFLVNPKIK